MYADSKTKSGLNTKRWIHLHPTCDMAMLWLVATRSDSLWIKISSNPGLGPVMTKTNHLTEARQQ